MKFLLFLLILSLQIKCNNARESDSIFVKPEKETTFAYIPDTLSEDLRYSFEQPFPTFYFKEQVARAIINGRKYDLLLGGINYYDTIGFFRKEGRKIFYIDNRFKSYSQNDPRLSEQLFFNFDLELGDKITFYGSSFFPGKNTFQLTSIEVDSVYADTLYNLKRLKESTSYGIDDYHLTEISIGQQVGFVKYFYEKASMSVLKYHFFRKSKSRD
ncbi:MAG: hypothetical protein ABIQ40_03225 [Bacteroidia bacterium]